ncbi:MAG: hypothetical protein JW934_22715 [Anaerolineae bacterium]|nr:hypothetical protein [Anaerolineae bacterium]
MSELGHFMQDLAEAMEVTFQVDKGMYSLEIPTLSGRSQVVNVTTRDSGVGGEMILFYTPVGAINEDIDWQSLLELNVGTIYARTGIIDDYVVVVAGQMLETADVSEVITILTEVGSLGDLLEDIFYDEDRF